MLTFDEVRDVLRRLPFVLTLNDDGDSVTIDFSGFAPDAVLSSYQASVLAEILRAGWAKKERLDNPEVVKNNVEMN